MPVSQQQLQQFIQALMGGGGQNFVQPYLGGGSALAGPQQGNAGSGNQNKFGLGNAAVYAEHLKGQQQFNFQQPQQQLWQQTQRPDGMNSPYSPRQANAIFAMQPQPQQQQLWQQPRQPQQQQQQNPWASQMMRQAAIQPFSQGQQQNLYGGYGQTGPQLFGPPITQEQRQKLQQEGVEQWKIDGAYQASPEILQRLAQQQANPRPIPQPNYNAQPNFTPVQPQGGAYMNDGFRTGGGDPGPGSQQTGMYPGQGGIAPNQGLPGSYGSRQAYAGPSFGQSQQPNPYMQAMGFGGGSNVKDSYTDRYLQGGYGGGQQQSPFMMPMNYEPTQSFSSRNGSSGVFGGGGQQQGMYGQQPSYSGPQTYGSVPGNPNAQYLSPQQNPFMQSPFTAFGPASQGASRQQPIYGAGSLF